jgi:glycosyltransferase involved in cell wall biosynthesis
VGLLVAEVFGVPVSATIHGSAEFINPESQHIRDKVRDLDFVVAVSKYGRSQLMLNSDPAYWHKVHVVPLGVDTESDESVQRPWPRHGGSDAAPPFELSCVGQLQPAKGVHVLLDAMAMLKSRGRRVRLTLVGDGPYAAALRERALHLGVEVRFTGRLGQADVTQVYLQSDAFVLASFAEGVPVVLMEAMRHGLPCIATRITGVPELIREGIDGLLVTPSDVEEMADAIAAIIDDSSLARRLGASGRERVRTHYNLSSNARTLGAVFSAKMRGLLPDAPPYAE